MGILTKPSIPLPKSEKSDTDKYLMMFTLATGALGIAAATITLLNAHQQLKMTEIEHDIFLHEHSIDIAHPIER